MATASARPNTVDLYAWAGDGTGPLMPGTALVGATPLRDDLDTSYATLTLRHADGVLKADAVRFRVDAPAIDPAIATDVTIRLRVSATGTPAVTAWVYLGTDAAIGGILGMATPVPGAPTDLVMAEPFGPIPPATLATLLADPTRRLYVQPAGELTAGDPDQVLTVYEVWVDYTYPAVPWDQWMVPDAEGDWIEDEARSAGLLGWGLTAGRRAPAGRVDATTITATLASAIAGPPPQLGDPFRIMLPRDWVEPLGIDADAAVRFTGEVTDVIADPVTGIQTVTGVGKLARQAMDTLDGRGWPVEIDGGRVLRILTAIGADVGDLDAGTAALVPAGGLSTAAALLDLVVASTGGQIVEQRDGTVDYRGALARYGVTVPVLTLAAGEILTSFVWTQRRADLVNVMTVGYGNNGQDVQVVDPVSRDTYGPYPQNVATALVDASAAYDLGVTVVGRRGEPAWNLPAVPVDMLRSIDPAKVPDVATLQYGDLIAVTGPPPEGGDPAPQNVFVEGWTETLTKTPGTHDVDARRAWRIAFNVSDPRQSGLGLTWNDAPEALAWEGADPDLTWLDLATITDPADLEA